MADLIERLRNRLEEAGGSRPPATLRDLREPEARLRFGPAYGLLGIVNGAVDDREHDTIDAYEEYRQRDLNDPYWDWPIDWPAARLPSAARCNLCVNCLEPEGPVIWFEPNPHEDGSPWTSSFIPLAKSTEAWLSAWEAGDDLFDKLTKFEE